jgi:hypothetical protein
LIWLLQIKRNALNCSVFGYSSRFLLIDMVKGHHGFAYARP